MVGVMRKIWIKVSVFLFFSLGVRQRIWVKFMDTPPHDILHGVFKGGFCIILLHGFSFAAFFITFSWMAVDFILQGGGSPGMQSVPLAGLVPFAFCKSFQPLASIFRLC
ncbi:hypothetical protein HOY82DRAFT_354198 [Tuber indicum]|nr:hypothetical protein HOY82DRAFT_354198 [Tuber indicum]